VSKLFLRNSQTHGITGTGDGILYDMLSSAGAASDTAVTNTAASGTQIQATKTAGGSTIAWISERAPVGGFTLTNTNISMWQIESSMNANVGGRYRLFKRATNGTITEIGGGPFDDGVEMQTSNTEDAWGGDVTDTFIAEDERLILRYYGTNIGTMAGSFTWTLTFNAADGSTGDSFFNIAETVSFKANTLPLTANSASFALSAQNASFARGRIMPISAASYALTGTAASFSRTRVFAFKRSLTIAAAQLGATDLTDFPVLVSFTDNSFKTVANGGRVRSSSGYDIAFFSDSNLTQQLAHEIDRYDPATGEIVMWVKLSSISHTVDTVFYVGYGHSDTPSSLENVAAVWSNSFVAIYHLRNGTTLQAVNSVTGSAATISGPTASAGQIDGSATVGASSTDKITTDVGAAATLRTYTIWAKRTGVGGGSAGRMFNKGTATTTEYLSYVDSTSSYDYSQFWTTGASWRAPAPSASVWHHVAVRYDSSSSANAPLIDIDAVSQTVTPNSSPTGSKTTNAEVYVLGNRGVDNIRNWAGDLDEFRIADAIRSDSWITAEVNNQKASSTFLALGAEVGGAVLTAGSASFALTAQAANLTKGRKLTAATGSYALTANNTGLLRGRLLSAAQSSFALSDQNANLLTARRLVAAQASLLLTAQNVLLSHGFAALVGSSASFSLSTQNVNLLRGRRLTANVATFTETVFAVNLPRTRILPAATASFTLSAPATTLRPGRAMLAQSASFVLTENTALLSRTRRLAANAAAFTETAFTSNLLIGRRLVATQTTFTYTAQNTTFLKSRAVVAQSSVYSFTANTVALRADRRLVASPASLALTTQPAALRQAHKIVAASASFSLTEFSAQFRATHVLQSNAGSFSLSAQPATIFYAHRLLATTAFFTFTGYGVADLAGFASGMTFFTGSTELQSSLFSGTTTLVTFTGTTELQSSVFTGTTTLDD
jgi:hypothetical protein